ncbi:hypothetical protein ACEPAH_8887 [Sanghuangporus vaninii]
MRRSETTLDTDDGGAIFDIQIAGDEEEQHRRELENNLKDLSFQFSLSDPSQIGDQEEGDEQHDTQQKRSESSFSLEFPRHNSRRQDVSIFHGQNSSFLDNTQLVQGDDVDYDPYRSVDDAEVHFVGNTMSTVAHHASAVTLSAGLGGRSGKRVYAAESSLSGAEYDPDRPLDSVLNGVADELSLLNVDNSLAHGRRTTRHTANTQAQVTFDPLAFDGGIPAIIDGAKNHGSSKARNSKQPQDHATSFLSDRDETPRLKSRAKHPSLNVQPPTPSVKANATCGSSTTNGSKFTRMAKSLAREIEASQRWITVPELENKSPAKASRKKQAIPRSPFRDVVNQMYPQRGKGSGHIDNARPGRPSSKIADVRFDDLLEQEQSQSRMVCLPDVTGLTSAVDSPPRKEQQWRRYSGGSEGERVEVELIKTLTTLQTRLNQLESQNLVSRRRIQELEYDLDACKLEVKRERTRVMERDEIIVAQQRDFQKQRAALSRPVRKVPDPANEARYREVVEEKKALESLVATLRSHLSRLTDDLSNHQAQLDELRSLRQNDFSDLRAKITEVDELRLEVERLAGEVDILRGVVEEGLNERRKAKESLSFADDSNCAVPEVPTTSKRENVLYRGDSVEEGSHADFPSPPPSPPQSRQKRELRSTGNKVATSGPNLLAQRDARVSEKDERRRRSGKVEDCPSDGSELQHSRDVDNRRVVRDIRGIRVSRKRAADIDVHRAQRTGPEPPLRAESHADASSKPGNPQCEAASPFPQIRGERLERLFFSAPAHNEKTCRVCHRHLRPGTIEDEFDFPSWLPPRKRVKIDQGDDRVRHVMYDDKSEDEYQTQKNRAPFSEDRLPPQTVLARVLRELEDDFTHFKGIYIELADQYKIIDAASNVAKRNVLAEHLKEVINTLEQKGDQIASLYDLLTFRDKPAKGSVVTERKSVSRMPRSPRALRQTAAFPVIHQTRSLLSTGRVNNYSMHSSVADRPTKKNRTSPAKTIGTHNGTFHCDEALACFLLRWTSAYQDSAVVRTRDPKILDTCDIVVDVGGVYDHDSQRYDHHQRGFDALFGHGFATKLSSAGLIYKYYGKEIIASRLHLPVDSPEVNLLWLKLYKEFIEAIDAIDNGIPQYPQNAPAGYKNRTDLSSRVGWLNPPWNEPKTTAEVDALFARASAMTGEEFFNRLDYYAKSWMPARDLVASALSSRKEVHPSGRIILFEQFAPWKEHLFDIEQEQAIPEKELPLYVLYPDETASNWRIQAVPVSPDSFESRKSLPEPWRGVRDGALSQLTEIPGCIFVHASGFIGGNTTKEGVMAMAIAALE